MGEQLYRTFPAFKTEFDVCAEILKPELGVDLREVVFPAADPAVAPSEAPKTFDFRKMVGRDGRAPSASEQRLNRTAIAQPALFVVEYALAKQLLAWGIQPAAMIGYSLGEYVAACLAGVLGLEDSLLLVARRAQLIEKLPPGAMLAVTMSEEQVRPYLGAHLSVSAVNGPDLCVVAGPPEDVHALEKQLAERGATVRRVQSTHAFHSAMMAPIADDVTALARGFRFHAPAIPYASNVTGKLITAAEATDPAYWARHLTSAVRFSDGLRSLAQSDVVFVEAGPGQTLSSIAITAPDLPVQERIVVPAMRNSYDGQPDGVILFKALSKLWGAGAAVDWSRFPSRSLAVSSEPPRAVGPSAAANAPTERATFDTPTEKQLLEIWTAIFRGATIAPTVSFFELGGNSLTATRLVQRIQKAFGVKLSLKHVYGAPTLRGMATSIDDVRVNPAAPVRKAAPPKAAAAPMPASMPRLELPNGLVVAHQNEAETRHFYDDIFAHRSYVKHGIVIPDGACVFDVGANIGLFTLFAHKEAKDVRVFSFEPAPQMFALLRANVADHGIRATTLNVGLSDAERETSFTFYPRSTGMSSFHADEAEEKHNLKTIIENQRRTGEAAAEQVAQADQVAQDELLDVRFQSSVFPAKLRRVSDVIREHGIERIDLMKVDVQKCELEVIDGIDDGDWQKISQIVLEAHDTDGRVATLRSRMESRGFSVFVHQDELYVGTNIYNLYAVRQP